MIDLHQSSLYYKDANLASISYIPHQIFFGHPMVMNGGSRSNIIICRLGKICSTAELIAAAVDRQILGRIRPDWYTKLNWGKPSRRKGTNGPENLPKNHKPPTSRPPRLLAPTTRRRSTTHYQIWKNKEEPDQKEPNWPRPVTHFAGQHITKISTPERSRETERKEGRRGVGERRRGGGGRRSPPILP